MDFLPVTLPGVIPQTFRAVGNGIADDRNALADAAAAIPDSGGDLLLVGTYRIGSDLTFASNVRLVFSQGAMLRAGTGVTVTINGPLEAPLRKVFDLTGTGRIVFGTGAVREFISHWWGADPTGVIDSAPAINNSIAAALTARTAGGGAIVRILAGYYTIGSTLEIGPGQVDGLILEGNGMGATYIKLLNTKNVDMIQMTASASSFFLGIRDMTLDGNYQNNLVSGHCINVLNNPGPSDVIFERIFAKNARQDGFHFGASTYSPWIIGCISEFNQGYGINAIPNVMRIIGGKYQSDVTGCILLQGGTTRKTSIIDGAYILCDATSAAKGLYLQCAQATVTGCHIVNGAANTGDLIYLSGPGGDYTLSGNMIVGAQATGNAIRIDSGVTNVNIHDNDFIGTFAAGKILLSSVAATSIAIRHNWGFNPFGIIASPFDNVNNLIGMVGTSGTLTSAKVYTCTGVPVDIFWTGGTVSAQSKNGTAIPSLAAASDFIHLEPGDTYSITFSVTPTTFDVFGL